MQPGVLTLKSTKSDSAPLQLCKPDSCVINRCKFYLRTHVIRTLCTAVFKTALTRLEDVLLSVIYCCDIIDILLKSRQIGVLIQIIHEI